MELKLHVSNKQKACSEYFLETRSGKVAVRNEMQEVKLGTDDYSPFRLGYMMPEKQRAPDILGR